ncbi:MAG: hypothetical protein FD176_179 [Rhodospirillaceae bacterium]|nr:MAG: hypothetical protein FD176_179 [Rhodospirillaceae bacterium]TNC98697.1 MAG: hypothetical protein FD119_168 [Stygiobacter sp.]
MPENALRNLNALADALSWLAPHGPVRLRTEAENASHHVVQTFTPAETRALSALLYEVINQHAHRLVRLLQAQCAAISLQGESKEVLGMLAGQREKIIGLLDEHPDLMRILADSDCLFAGVFGDRARDCLDVEGRIQAITALVDADTGTLDRLAPEWWDAGGEGVSVLLPESFGPGTMPVRRIGETDEEYESACDLWRSLVEIGLRERERERQRRKRQGGGS